MIIPILGAERDTLDLTETELQVLIEIEPLLRRARLHIACPRCLAAGHGVNSLVGGSNGPEDKRWSVDCQCTSRIYRRGSH